MIPKSIRWRLPLSYAAIALLAALSLGAVLLTSLRRYYMQRELDYLNSNAGAISLVMAHLLADNPSPEALEARLRGFSFLSQTRVRLLDESGEIIADSFSPQERHERVGLAFDVPAGIIWQRAIPGEEDYLPAQVEVEVEHRISPEAVQKIETVEKKNVIIVLDNAPEQNVMSRTVVITTSEVSAPSQIIAYRQTVKSGQPLPGPPDPLFLSVAGTPYGFDLSAEIADDSQRSDQSVRRPFYDPDGNLRYIELSEGPAYGRQILNSVAQGWAIASGVAVLLAAGAGWLISRRINTPLLALADVTMDIAGGNLSTRADVTRQDELGLLARSFNEMADQVEETVVALRRFVADAAHELHTPLTALRTDLELVADAESEPERQRLVGRAQTQLDRLRTLIASLLELSRLEAGARQSQMVLFDLSSFIQEMSEPYASQAEQAGLTLSLQVPAETVSVQGDKAQLKMAISNLLDNALKFTPEGGKVIVRLQSYQPWAELQIEDSGIGIPPEDLPRLFSRFHRGRNAGAYPGSGLGLAIVKAIIEGHGGQVMAENTGQGARFSVQLPIENR